MDTTAVGTAGPGKERLTGYKTLPQGPASPPGTGTIRGSNTIPVTQVHPERPFRPSSGNLGRFPGDPGIHLRTTRRDPGKLGDRARGKILARTEEPPVSQHIPDIKTTALTGDACGFALEGDKAILM